ncbi:MAG: glycosyltransferase [Pseudomonadota bacterium]
MANRDNAEPIRILQLTHGLHFGGLERVVIDLSRRLNQDPRYEVQVCTVVLEGAQFKILKGEGIQVRHMGKKPGLDCSLFFKLARFFKAGRFDIVHAHGPVAYFHGACAAKLARVPAFVYTEHGRDWDQLSLRTLLSERLAASLTTRIVAVSAHARNCLMARERMPARKVEVILNGIDDSPFATARGEAIRKELRVAPDQPLVGFVSRLQPQKGPTYLIEAARLVVDRLPSARFVLTGDGEHRLQVEETIDRLGLRQSVVLTGWRSDIHDIISALDIFVLPSVWEGTPLVVLEAMAAGKPIVATEVGGVPAVLDNEQTALLVRPSDPAALAESIIRLLQDRALMARIGRQAREVFKQKYSLGTMFAGYERIYHQCLQGKIL